MDMVVWWKDACTFVKTCPSSARRFTVGVARVEP